MDYSRGGLILENISVESDCMYKSAVNSTADQYIEWNHMLGWYFSKW